jgi:transposase
MPPELASIVSAVARFDDALGAAVGTLAKEREDFRKAYELARTELERLRRQLFGKKGERVDAAQVQLVFAALEKVLDAARAKAEAAAGLDAQLPPAPPSGRRRHPHGRRLPEDLDSLPEVRIEIPSPIIDASKVCIGEETSLKVEWRRGHFVRSIVVKPRYVTKATQEEAMTSGCSTKIIEPEPLPEIVAGGLLAPGAIAKLIVDKFWDHIPFNRQVQRWAREGVRIDRSTMGRYAKAFAAHGQPIVDAMENDARAHAHVIATDATGVLVQAPDQCRRGHFWVAIADRAHVFFRFTPKGDGNAAKSFLGGFKGRVQADASSVYDALFAERDGPEEVGCWSHARRNFHKCIGVDTPRAFIAIGFIDKLFEIERRIHDSPPGQRLAVRRAHSQIVLDHLYDWARTQEQTLDDDRSPLLRALGYLRRHRDALCRFVDDPQLRIDNNPSELALRHLVIGRKNWLFVGSDEGGRTTATIVSLLASAKLHRHEPWQYIRDLCRLLPIWPRHRALELCPRDWAATRAKLRDDQLEPSYGQVDIPPPA